ncbi:MAG: hypothetical protein B7X99_19760 [Rhizobiales bacterium 17-65-6]|nr:MAG: hypothetical protein B7X99_19760 [Rhizobiales bacterium 17-65-6]
MTGIAVTVDGAPLPERTDLLDTSKDGCAWSYEGYASSQLAVAVAAADSRADVVLHGERDDEPPGGHGKGSAALVPGTRFQAWEGAGCHLMAHDPHRLARWLLRLCAAESPAMIVASQ